MATPWTDLVNKLQSELATGSLETKEVEVGGMKRVLRSYSDVLAFLNYAKQEAAQEGTSESKPIGRLQWRTRRD